MVALQALASFAEHAYGRNSRRKRGAQLFTNATIQARNGLQKLSFDVNDENAIDLQSNEVQRICRVHRF